MPLGVKTLIGTFVLILIILVYAVFAVAIASLYLGQSSAWVHLAYFFFSGMLWVLPAMWIIKWMATPSRS